MQHQTDAPGPAGAEPYEAPALIELGSTAELTLGDNSIITKTTE